MSIQKCDACAYDAGWPYKFDRCPVCGTYPKTKEPRVQIQILAVNQVTKTNKAGKPMQVLEVAYKNLSFNGKVESKQLFDFGVQADTFKALAVAKGADFYDVDVVKNTAGYNDWVKVSKSNGVSTAPTASAVGSAGSTGSSTSTKGGWETPAERAAKQIYIVRQSSISAAVSALSVGVKTGPKAEEVIEYARQLEAFVFSADQAKATVSKDVGSIEELDEDLPF
jgi:hypothetical protein